MASEKHGLPAAKIVDKYGHAISVDEMTRAVININYSHHEIHEGSSFTVTRHLESAADNASIWVAFKTPAGEKVAHMFPQFNTLAAAHLKIIENANWTASTGTLVPIINRNRNSTKESILEENKTIRSFNANNNVIASVTGLSATAVDAVILPQHYVFSVKQAGGGERRSTEEYILKANTQYAFVVVADAGSNALGLDLNWYEHTTKSNDTED